MSLFESLKNIVFQEEQATLLKEQKFYRDWNVFACKNFFLEIPF